MGLIIVGNPKQREAAGRWQEPGKQCRREVKRESSRTVLDNTEATDVYLIIEQFTDLSSLV